MKLFVSYSRDDKAWVYELWRNLRDEGHHDAWIDRRIVPATDWWATILTEIERCECFVYVMTPKAVESIYCRAELDYAVALGKPVLPLMLKPCDFPDNLNARRVQYQVITDDMDMMRTLYKIEQGLTEVRIGYERNAYPPVTNVKRPDVPKPNREPEHLFETFDLAEEAAAEDNLTLAQALFQQIIGADPHGLGLAAQDRLKEIRYEHERKTAYKHLVRMMADPKKRKGALAVWRNYVQRYGTDYDPQDIASRVPDNAAPSKPKPKPAPPPDPKPQPKPFDITQAMADFFTALNAAEWDDAASLLDDIESSGQVPEFFGIGAYRQRVDDERERLRQEREAAERAKRAEQDRLRQEREAAERAEQERLRQEREAAERQQERDRQYALLRVMAQYEPPDKVWRALQAFWQDFPDYDPDDFARFKPVPRITDILPPPFAWITIPAGDVTLEGREDSYIPEGETQLFRVPAFQIAKYPITNAQYRVFVQAGGYDKRQYWTDEGWQTKLEGWEWQGSNYQKTGQPWTQPRYWDDDRFKGDDKPVVGVSWYECVAFCNWLNEAAPPPTGRIVLPTEQQWQRAAQGDDGRVYPWGNGWDCKRCNNSVSPCDSNATTPVTQYETLGASPYGVVDMAGNVWEWCLTAYETGETDVRGTNVRRVLRGGSWADDGTNNFRVAFRSWVVPHLRIYFRGCRISLS